MSAGPKFGADLLAYPGDPGLFHAQVCMLMRVCACVCVLRACACACRVLVVCG